MAYRTVRERKAEEIAFLRFCGVLVGLPILALGIALVVSGTGTSSGVPWWAWALAASWVALGAYLVLVSLLGSARSVERLPLPGTIEVIVYVALVTPLYWLGQRLRGGVRGPVRRRTRRRSGRRP